MSKYTPAITKLNLTLCSRFGFRYWKDPGPWAGADPSNRLMSFVNAVNVAAFCMGGPEYISSKFIQPSEYLPANIM
jgi:amino acid permease